MTVRLGYVHEDFVVYFVPSHDAPKHLLISSVVLLLRLVALNMNRVKPPGCDVSYNKGLLIPYHRNHVNIAKRYYALPPGEDIQVYVLL
jgi:hypothetical protein